MHQSLLDRKVEEEEEEFAAEHRNSIINRGRSLHLRAAPAFLQPLRGGQLGAEGRSRPGILLTAAGDGQEVVEQKQMRRRTD